MWALEFVKVAEVWEDISGHVLREWLNAGFRELVWEYGFEPWQDAKTWREIGSVCPICFALDGQHFKIQWVLDNQTHNAPKYSLSHVGCKCRFRRLPREKEILDFMEELKMEPPPEWITPEDLEKMETEKEEVEMLEIPSPA